MLRQELQAHTILVLAVFRTSVYCLLMGPCCELVGEVDFRESPLLLTATAGSNPRGVVVRAGLPSSLRRFAGTLLSFFRVRGTSLFYLRTSTSLNVSYI